jgi:hypothetical protein
MTTGYPFHGTISIRITETDDAPWSLSIRVPEWATGAVLSDRDSGKTVGGGTATITRSFAVGDRIELELPLGPRWTVPDPRIDAIRGCIAWCCASNQSTFPGVAMWVKCESTKVRTRRNPKAGSWPLAVSSTMRTSSGHTRIRSALPAEARFHYASFPIISGLTAARRR